MGDGYIYHERQASALCGQHCLNNLLQGAYFDPGALADIAHELDAMERQMMLSEGAQTADALRYLAEDSGNVDASGNFSIQVLNKALERSHGVSLTHFGSEEKRGSMPSSSSAALSLGGGPVAGGDEAFVLNRSDHWFTVRLLFGKFWNLNSTNDAPEFIGDFYLSSLLAQFRADGYSVFVASPAANLPPPPREDLSAGRSGMLGSFHRVSDLAGPGGIKGQRAFGKGARLAAGGGAASASAPADPWANAGSGRSLRSSGPVAAASGASASGGKRQEVDGDEALARVLAGGGSGDTDGMGDDDDLAMAIAMSMTATAPPLPAAALAPGPSDGAAKRPRSDELPAEAEPGEPSARVLLQGLGKGRPTRRFRASDPASLVFDWVDRVAIDLVALAAFEGQAASAATAAVADGRYDLLLARDELSRAGVGEKTFEGAGLAPSAALTVRPR